MNRAVISALVLAAALAMPARLLAQSQPPRPAVGPGSNLYSHLSLTAKGPFWAAGFGRDDNYLYYIYEPAWPTPASAPVVLFLHGWLAYEPLAYAGWIQHMVRKGHVVVWAQYDAGLSLPVRFPEKAMITWKDALQRLVTQPGHVRPSVSNGALLTGIVGHSVGGYMSAILAALAANPANGIPKPQAVVAVEPGGFNVIKREDLSGIDPATKMVAVVGDRDIAVGSEAALEIWSGTPQVPDANRDFLVVRSDDHGDPDLVADHNFPLTGGMRAKIDTLDLYVTYKLTVGALNCAFKGADCQYALGNGSLEQVGMGKWSDGVAATPMLWLPDPGVLTGFGGAK